MSEHSDAWQTPSTRKDAHANSSASTGGKNAYQAIALFILIVFSTAASFAWGGVIARGTIAGSASAQSQHTDTNSAVVIKNHAPSNAGLPIIHQVANPLNLPTPLRKVDHALQKGVFLVATENLKYSSFRETVVLITHASERGATGIAINRPSKVSLREAYPDIKQFKKHDDELYLGGPVLSNRLFVLMLTEHPHKDMHAIVKNLFFTTGPNALAHGMESLKPGEFTRAYAGYAGWAPGQLEAEIKHGDWRVVAHDPSIIFDSNTQSVWYRLYERFSGNWI